jgi:hypothetical protein
LNEWSVGAPEVLRYDNPVLSDLLSKDDPPLRERPVALMPVYNSPRLAAQRGMFTLHGSNALPIESMLPTATELPTAADPRVWRIKIPEGSVLSIRESLRQAGVTDISMFPEMTFLCQDILRASKILGGPVQVRK